MPESSLTKVLMIDDSEVDRYTYSRFLKHGALQYEVHEAANSQSGLALAENLNPDCILLDLNLPGKESGIEVLRELIGDEYPPKRQVIILTVLGWDSLRQGALSFGASAYLVKGQTDAVALDQAIRQVTRKGHNYSFSRIALSGRP